MSAAPDTSTRPGLVAPRPWSFPTARRTRLDNGIELHVFDLPGQHVITAGLVLDTPLNAEPRDLEGVATICARTLDEGSTEHPGEQFAELMEDEGAGFAIDVSTSGLQAVLDVPVTRLVPALQLFAEAVRRPAFAPADVSRHVALRLAQIEQVRANSAQTAALTFRSAVFDADSRAARMNAGEPETVAAVDVEAVRAFHRRAFGPVGTHLVLAGDFSAAGPTPEQLADAVFGDWDNPEQETVAYLPAPAAAPSAVLVDRPGAVAADVRLGGFGPDRLDPRWADLSVASYAMGGAFLSRLNKVLREDRGYTYGVHLSFAPLRTGGTYAVQGSFRTGVAAAAVEEALGLLDVTERRFDADEVAAAQTYFAGVSPLQYATADAVADQAATQVLAGLPENYVDRRLAALQAVTPDSATAAYTGVVDLSALTLVVVGDAASLADPLRSLGFDQLQVRARDR